MNLRYKKKHLKDHKQNSYFMFKIVLLLVFLTSNYFSPKNIVSFLPIGDSFSLLAVRSAQLYAQTSSLSVTAYTGRMQNLLCSCFISYLYLHRRNLKQFLSTGRRPHHTIQIWFTNLLTAAETSQSHHHWCLNPQCSRWLFTPWTTCSQSIHTTKSWDIWSWKTYKDSSCNS